MVAGAGIPIVDIPFVTVGGGIGCFVTVDYLRIAGVPTSSRSGCCARSTTPWQTYEYLTRVSQIPRGERLRSDSASRPDNIWGFPSLRASARRSQRNAQGPLWQSVHRADLRRLLHPEGRPGVRDDGARGQPDRLRRDAGQGPGADGAPAVRRRLLHHPDAARGRHRPPSGSRSAPVRPHRRRLPGPEVPARPAGLPRPSTTTTSHVVNAYEPHEHVYERLHARGPARC